MPERKKVLAAIKCCIEDSYCEMCPYSNKHEDCTDVLFEDLKTILNEQDQIINQYKTADSFLAAHGWIWRENADG